MAKRASLHDQRTDAELVRAAQGGEARALGVLLARHESSVRRLGSLFCKNADAAREVQQETLLAAVRGLPGYRGDAAVDTWLFAIARHACTKLRRRRRRASAISCGDPNEDDLCEVLDPLPQPDDVVMAHELGLLLQRAIAELPASYRDVLVLRDADGWTAPEVAAALGLGVAAVKSRLHRARTVVREALAPLAPWVDATDRSGREAMRRRARR